MPREADADEAPPGNGDAAREGAPPGNEDGSGVEVPPPDGLPEEPDGWFGQGELDLFAPAGAGREAEAGAGEPADMKVLSPPGRARDEGGRDRAEDSGAEIPEAHAAGKPSPPAEEKSAPAALPEPARAPPDADDGDGLIRF